MVEQGLVHKFILPLSMESFCFGDPVAFHLVLQCFSLWPDTWKTNYISISLSCILCSCLALFPPLALALSLSLGPSGTQHAPRVNTNKQGLPSSLPLPIQPGEFMWDGEIASLRSIVSIAPRGTSQTQRKHTSETFTSHRPFVSLLSVMERHRQRSILCLETQGI